MELFATPEEQLTWLNEAGAAPEVWCVLERPRVSRQEVTHVARLSLDSLGNEHSRARLFLGRSGAPVWRATAVGTELDFVASGAVLFEPAVVAKRTLLAGRLAIMARQDYEDAGAGFASIEEWYTALLRSLRRGIGAGKVELVVVSPNAPRARARGSFVVSRGALELARAGAALKQFPESNVILEVA